MLYRFDVEGLAARNGKLMATRDGRHFLIGGIPGPVIDKLIACFEHAASIGLDQLPGNAHQTLVANNILVPTDEQELARYQAARAPRTRALAYRMANPIRLLGSGWGLVALAGVSLLLFMLFQPSMRFLTLAAMVEGMPLSDIAITLATLFATIAIHELGHAAAACYYTGTVGEFHFRFIWGMPAVTVDVTSFCLTGRKGKVAISVAGGVFQVTAALAAIALSDVPAVHTGAVIGIFLAIINLLPLPLYDGYWVLVDLLGRRVMPRLARSRDWIEIAYGAVLLALFVFSAPYVYATIMRQIFAAAALLQQAPVRGAVLAAFSAFAVISFTMFAWSLFKSLFGKPAPKAAPAEAQLPTGLPS